MMSYEMKTMKALLYFCVDVYTVYTEKESIGPYYLRKYRKLIHKAVRQ